MTDRPDRWTPSEWRAALKAFLAGDAGKRYFDTLNREFTNSEDLRVFMRDAERRTSSDDQEAVHWWNTLQKLLREEPIRYLALVEPLAQNGLSIDEIFDCLPDEFDPDALTKAINQARFVQSGTQVSGYTNTTGWDSERIRLRLEEVKKDLGFDAAPDLTRQWWEDFETENQSRLGVVLRLAEDILLIDATITEFYVAFEITGTANIQAVLHYLKYEKLRANEVSENPDAILTTPESGWWMKPAPRMTRVKGWSDDQILNLLEEVKQKLYWDETPDHARRWWLKFESENTHRPALILRVAEELAVRQTTITEFHRTSGLSRTKDIQANLAFLDYSLLTSGEGDFETVVLNDAGEILERRRGKSLRFIEVIAPGVSIEMIEIPGGSFQMGTAEGEVEKVIEEYTRYGLEREDAEKWVNSERPQHTVNISSFYIGKYTVTQEQWNVIAGWEKIERDLATDPSNFKGSDHPVERISWEDAQEFCARLSAKTGRVYRLPTEAEWEYACRAGTTTPFAFGETITPEIVNYDGNRPYGKAKKGEYREKTIPVGSLGVANAFGLYDMHGNVWEWCQDWYSKDYYAECHKQGVVTDPQGPETGETRVLRGGSWYDYGYHCRSASRISLEPGYRDDHVGLRVVVSARTLS